MATKADEVGHGTCVAAMAVDEEFGIAKKAKIIPVKVKTFPVPDNSLEPAVFDIGGLLSGLKKVRDHIIANRRKNPNFKAVVNLSLHCESKFSWPTSYFSIHTNCYWQLAHPAMIRCIQTHTKTSNCCSPRLCNKMFQSSPHPEILV